MKLGIRLITNIKYDVVLLLFLGTMTVFSYLSPGDFSVGFEPGYAYQQAGNEQVPPAQLPPKSMMVKITSPAESQNLPIGELQISGTSTDNAATDCQVLVDVNDMKPFQKVTATGPGGQNDYSSWSFKYTDAYHLITEGPNELTAKLSCSDKDIKPKWHTVNITGISKKPVPYNVLFTKVMSNESSPLLSNNTQQGSPVEERKQNITSPQGVNKTTDTPYPDVLLDEESTNATNELSIAENQNLSAVKVKGEITPSDKSYPDVLLDEESTNATNELSIAENQKLSAVKVKVKTTPTDTPYPDVLLEEEPAEGVIEEEEPEMQPKQLGLQDEQQQLSITEDQKTSALKVKEGTTKDKEGEVKEVMDEQPEMKSPKSPLQPFDIDNDRKVPANEQLQDEQQQLSITEDQKPSAVKIKETTNDKEGEGIEVGGEQPEMKSPLQWLDIDNDRKVPANEQLQDEQQQLSITEDQKPSAVKVREETTEDKEGEEKEVMNEQPEMKSPLQWLDIDNDKKVPANEQLQVDHTDVRGMSSAESMYSKIMSNLDE